MKKFTQILTAILFAAIAMPVAAQTYPYQSGKTNSQTLIPYKQLVVDYDMVSLGYKTGSAVTTNGNANIYRVSSAYSQTTALDGTKASWNLGTNKYYGDIVVPETINGTTVTRLRKAIGDGTGTFQCSYITSCHLPSGITTIDDASFSDCPYLEAITVAEGNKNFVSIDGCLYKLDNGVPTTLVAVPGFKASVKIEETVTSIATCALDGCRNIKELTISSTTLNSIGTYAFADMDLDKLTIYATEKVPSTSSNTFENCSIKAIYVDANLVNSYKSANNWKTYKDVIYPIEKDVVVGTFTVAANLTKKYNDDNEVYQIVEIEVTGKAGETFAADELPTGWTLTHADGTSYAMNLEFINDNKTVKVTFNELIAKTGIYTLSIPAHSLKTADGTKECDLAQFYWAIQEAEVVTKTVRKAVTLKLNDAEGDFSWSYTDDAGTPVKRDETHIVGNTLYIKTDGGVHDNKTNTTTITTTEYYSSNAEYVRTFNNNKWQALYVPFELDFNKLSLGTLEIAVVKDVFENVDAENNVVWFYVTAEILEAGGKIPANKPCLIRSIQAENATGISRTLSLLSGVRIEAVDGNSFDVTSAKGNTYRFKGQYTAGNLPKNDYTFAMSKGSLCQPTSDAVRLGAYRWYLEINPSDENTTATFSFGRFGNGENEGTTGLENVKVEIVNDNVYYDLSGRRVENPAKGIYIQNGKKVYVK